MYICIWLDGSFLSLDADAVTRDFENMQVRYIYINVWVYMYNIHVYTYRCIHVYGSMDPFSLLMRTR